MSTNFLAARMLVLRATLGLSNAPTINLSRSSCRILPGCVSVAPIKETPERMTLLGNASIRGFSMFKPFCRSMMVVYPGVTTGAMSSATVGGTSATFLVVTTMKSKDGSPSLTTFGILFITSFVS